MTDEEETAVENLSEDARSIYDYCQSHRWPVQARIADACDLPLERVKQLCSEMAEQNLLVEGP